MTNNGTNDNTPNSQREVTAINARTDAPSLDLDPIMVWNNGDVASAWDERLGQLLDAMAAHPDPMRLVWSDTNAPVMVECPTCHSVTYATSFSTVDDDDCVVCCNV
jgi:hypothetical protein